MAFETTRLSQAQGLTGADIAFMCQRAAMFCVKEAAGGSSKLQEMSEDADLFNQDETAPQSIRRRRAGEVHCSLGRWPECLFSVSPFRIAVDGVIEAHCWYCAPNRSGPSRVGNHGGAVGVLGKILCCLDKNQTCALRFQSRGQFPCQDSAAEIVYHRMQIRARTVEEFDDRHVEGFRHSSACRRAASAAPAYKP